MIIVKEIGTKRYSGKMKMHVIARCSCGCEFETRKSSITSKKHPVLHCRRCAQDIINSKNRKHGDATGVKLYDRWMNMKSRVNAKTGRNFISYLSKGIIVCDEWKDYLPFKEWAINSGYKEGLELDRINNNGNYEPSNCRWVTRSIQTQNTRLLRSTNTSGYRGVSRVKSGKYISRCTVNSKRVALGTYSDILDAARAYNLCVIENKLEHPLNEIL